MSAQENSLEANSSQVVGHDDQRLGGGTRLALDTADEPGHAGVHALMAELGCSPPRLERCSSWKTSCRYHRKRSRDDAAPMEDPSPEGESSCQSCVSQAY